MQTTSGSIAPLVDPLPDSATAGRRVGWALAIGSTFASSIVTPMARGAIMGGMDPFTLLLMRLLIAVGLLAGATAVTEPMYFRLDRRGMMLLGIVGLIGGIEICCFFYSLTMVDASMSAMIKSTQPLVVLLMLSLGGERLRARHWVRLALSMVGIYLLVGAGGKVEPFGFFLLLVSLLLYALEIVLTQWWLHDYDTRTTTLYLTAMMTLIIGLWWWVSGIGWQDPGISGWTVILVLAVVSTFFARLALFGAIRRIGSGQIALLWPVQTLLVIVLSVIFLKERFTLVQSIGGVLILTSALLAIERIGQWPWRKVAPT